MRDIKVSVIIPVHNGSAIIKKTVRTILDQKYNALEIVLVENGSSDNSLEVCRELGKKDNRVRVFHNEQKGTSLARKRGVEEATGSYIVFSDQDDSFVNRYCIRDMVVAICEDGTQICQFAHYRRYFFCLRKKQTSPINVILDREKLLSGEIAGVLGQPNCLFDTTVWSKIYDAEVLKDAVSNINIPLVYAEDMYLNIWAFFSEKTKRVSVRRDAYYVWNVGIGFSGNPRNNKVLFEEYQYIKDLTVAMGSKYDLPDRLIMKCHFETLYFHKNLVQQMIDVKMPKDLLLEEIKQLSRYEFLQTAKESVAQMPAEEKWKELEFMTSDYSEDEFLEWCVQNRPKQSKKQKFLKMLRSVRR